MIRAQTRFGGSFLTSQTQVVGTLTQMDVVRSFVPTQPLMCHVVEIRLDWTGTDGWDWPGEIMRIEQLGLPVIATIRSASEGGKWDGSDADRYNLYDRALSVASCADIEYRSGLLRRVSELAVKHQRALIVSYHNFEGTPDVEKLREVVRLAPNYGTIVKIATLTRTEDDVAALRELFLENCSASLCVMGMGRFANLTRSEFSRLGSCFVYGYLDQPVAPGQPSAADLMRAIGHRR